MRDEVGRRQRVTYDVLARVSKTQVLSVQPKDQELSEGVDADVYSTTTNTYDAFDHILQVTDQAGVSGASQVTTTSYDGYGRLSTRHLPAQDAGHSTVWTYDKDGAVATVTDARGVKATYGYNKRHLVTSVAYDTSGVIAGQNVAAASNVTLWYDAAGNRTKMEDGSGTVTYHYDALSRLTSESRNFRDSADASVNFTRGLSYEYNLAGELTSLTDPDGLKLLYAYNRAGQFTGVSGATSYGGVTNYASAVQYRAWGALKAMGYGNGRTLSATYNARLQVESFQVPGVMGSQYRYTTAAGGSDNDGRVKFVQDLTQADSPFDRSYAYDLAGRLTLAKTGSGARGGSLSSGPYHESFAYDVWGNTTSRTGKHWVLQTMTPHAATYVNDRATTGITYDADGRPRVTGTLETTYNAAGLMASAYDTAARDEVAAGLTVSQGYDGDGRRIKHVEDSGRTYYVRSTVLGAAVAEYGAAGQWQRGYVYGPGVGLVATRAYATGEYVEWVHSDPVTGNRRRTASTGSEVAEAVEELDPLGVDMRRCNPYSSGCGGSLEDLGAKGGLLSESRYGNALDRRAGCSIQGMAVYCDLLVAFISSGAAQECPDGNCGPRAGKDGKLHPLTTDPQTGQVGYWAEGRGDDPPDGTWTDPETHEVFPTTGTNTNRVWVSTTYVGLSQGATSRDPRIVNRDQVKKDVKKLLDSGDCADWVKQLINKASELYPGNPPAFTDPLQYFDELSFTSNRSGLGGQSTGNVLDGTGNVDVMQFPLDENSKNIKGYWYDHQYAWIVLHEIIHLAGSLGAPSLGYSDYELARAASQLPGAEMMPPFVPRAKNMQGTISGYWDDELKKHCNFGYDPFEGRGPVRPEWRR